MRPSCEGMQSQLEVLSATLYLGTGGVQGEQGEGPGQGDTQSRHRLGRKGLEEVSSCTPGRGLAPSWASAAPFCPGAPLNPSPF